MNDFICDVSFNLKKEENVELRFILFLFIWINVFLGFVLFFEVKYVVEIISKMVNFVIEIDIEVSVGFIDIGEICLGN